MGGYRDRREPLDQEEMQDAALRKNVFRAIAKDLVYDIRAKTVTDAPGEIARLMEKAFKAGLAAQKLDAHVDESHSTGSRRMTDRDLVPSALQAFTTMRIFGQSKTAAHPHGIPPHAVLFMTRQRRQPFSDATKEVWHFAKSYGRESERFSSKAIGPLIKAGLIDAWDGSNGGKFARFSEWGFELLVTGSTELPENRVQYKSSTVREWAGLLQDDYWHRAAFAMGLASARAEQHEHTDDEASDDDITPSFR